MIIDEYGRDMYICLSKTCSSGTDSDDLECGHFEERAMKEP